MFGDASQLQRDVSVGGGPQRPGHIAGNVLAERPCFHGDAHALDQDLEGVCRSDVG